MLNNSESPVVSTIESPIGPLHFAHVPRGWADPIAAAPAAPNPFDINAPVSHHLDREDFPIDKSHGTQTDSPQASIYLYSLTSPPFPSSCLACQVALTTMPLLQQHEAALAYKKVSKKVCPMPTSLPEDFRNICCIPEDPLLTLPPLSTSPPNFVPGQRLTEERLNTLELNKFNFLWPEELKLLQHILILNETGLAWTDDERGRFCDDYFSPVKIPVIEHIPWAHKNIPIPYGILNEVIQIFKDKIAASVYEPSDASYRSPFFCVKKKNGSLRLVHDLQPLNAVTICNSGVPPLTDQIIESMAGRACYTILDLFIGYDHRTLDIASCNLTTVQSPIGAMRLTCLPQGWTNPVAIFHDNIAFVLAPEVPHVACTFVDDTAIKGPATRYKTDDGNYETIPENPSIRKFIWEHLQDVHRVLHHLHSAGATVSAKKIIVACPEIVILRHKCTYNGRVPDDSKITHIRDWPSCKNLSDVQAFLGLASFMHVVRTHYCLAVGNDEGLELDETDEDEEVRKGDEEEVEEYESEDVGGIQRGGGRQENSLRDYSLNSRGLIYKYRVVCA